MFSSNASRACSKSSKKNHLSGEARPTLLLLLIQIITLFAEFFHMLQPHFITRTLLYKAFCSLPVILIILIIPFSINAAITLSYIDRSNHLHFPLIIASSTLSQTTKPAFFLLPVLFFLQRFFPGLRDG